MNQAGAKRTSSPALAALARVLTAVARVALHFQVTLPTLVEMLKRLLVEQAVRSVAASGGEPTDSRVHLLTGVHRKDVRRLRKRDPAVGRGALSEESAAARLVARWTADRRFLDKRDKARVLKLRREAAGDPPAFEDLVKDISRGDVRSRAMLEEMLRLRVVSLVGDDAVRLNEDAFVPTEDIEQKLFYLGLNVGDHALAAAHNVSGGKPPMLERSVHYDGLAADSVAALEGIARAQGMRLLQRLNRKALAVQRRDANAKEANQRFNAGIFFYREVTDAD